MNTQQTPQQENELFIDELVTICNETLIAVLNNQSFADLLRNLEGSLLCLKTERWDGKSLNALEIFYARKATLDGALALRRGDAESAAQHHRRAETAYSLYAVKPDDWRRIENNYLWLAALAANGSSFDERQKRYQTLKQLRQSERIHAWSLMCFGKPYYYLSLLLRH